MAVKNITNALTQLSLTSEDGREPTAEPCHRSIDKLAGEIFLTGPPSSDNTPTVNTSQTPQNYECDILHL